MMNYKIAAVVVTFNRLEMLKECVNSLRNQTYKLDEIIVVNNSSTDGTLAWLNTQIDLTILTQENSGSAGGQYSGIKTAYEKGYDWIWCTEDEIVTDQKCIEKLLEFTNNNEFSGLAPIRYSYKKEPLYSEVVSFNPQFIIHSKRYMKGNSKLYNENGFVQLYSCTFEGLLLNSHSVEAVGLPNKNLFLWFDDVEYCGRLNSYKHIYLIPGAKIYKNRSDININFAKSIKNDFIKEIYGIRNLVYLEKNKRGNSIRKNLSLLFYLLRFYKYYLNNRKILKKIKITFLRCILISLRYFIYGFQGKLGEINFLNGQ